MKKIVLTILTVGLMGSGSLFGMSYLDQLKAYLGNCKKQCDIGFDKCIGGEVEESLCKQIRDQCYGTCPE